MTNLLYIRQELDKLKNEIDAYPLKTDDLRTSYIELTYSSLELYYRQWCSVYSAKIISKKEIDLTDKEKEILEIFIGAVSNNTAFVSVRNGIHRSLLTETWSVFEFCLTYICGQVFDAETKNELLEHDFKEIGKILTRCQASEADTKKAKKLFSKGHLSHVPVNRKYNKLHSIFTDNYNGDWEIDKEFLEFYGKYRNCMHTNYIYHGNDKEYTFLDTTYTFTNGEAVAHSKEPDITDMFKLSLLLKTTCRRLFDSIQYTDLLEYPADKVIQP